jgi:hypothetical protein
MMESMKLWNHSNPKDSEAQFRKAIEQTQPSQTEGLEQLYLELEAFDDPEYAALIAKFGDTGLEDFQPFLNENNA